MIKFWQFGNLFQCFIEGVGIHLLVISGDTITSVEMIPRLYTELTLN